MRAQWRQKRILLLTKCAQSKQISSDKFKNILLSLISFRRLTFSSKMHLTPASRDWGFSASDPSTLRIQNDTRVAPRAALSFVYLVRSCVSLSQRSNFRWRSFFISALCFRKSAVVGGSLVAAAAVPPPPALPQAEADVLTTMLPSLPRQLRWLDVAAKEREKFNFDSWIFSSKSNLERHFAWQVPRWKFFYFAKM